MPMRPMTTCSYPGCNVLVRGGRCDRHRSQSRRESDERRGSSAARGYGYRWQRASRAFLKKNPLCKFCQVEGRSEPAVVVDHIIPHRGDMALFWDEGNWQGLCKRHHDRKTAEGG